MDGEGNFKALFSVMLMSRPVGPRGWGRKVSGGKRRQAREECGPHRLTEAHLRVLSAAAEKKVKA